MKTQSVLLKLEPEFVGRIDEARGDVPRTVWIRRACEGALGGSSGLRAGAVVAEVGMTILRGPTKPIPPQNPAVRARLEKITRDALGAPGPLSGMSMAPRLKGVKP